MTSEERRSSLDYAWDAGRISGLTSFYRDAVGEKQRGVRRRHESKVWSLADGKRGEKLRRLTIWNQNMTGGLKRAWGRSAEFGQTSKRGRKMNSIVNEGENRISMIGKPDLLRSANEE